MQICRPTAAASRSRPGTNLPVRFARIRRAVCLQDFRRALHRQSIPIKNGLTRSTRTPSKARSLNKAQLDKITVFIVDLGTKRGRQIALGGSSPQSPNERCPEVILPANCDTDLPVSCRTNRKKFWSGITITPSIAKKSDQLRQ